MNHSWRSERSRNEPYSNNRRLHTLSNELIKKNQASGTFHSQNGVRSAVARATESLRLRTASNTGVNLRKKAAELQSQAEVLEAEALRFRREAAALIAEAVSLESKSDSVNPLAADRDPPIDISGKLINDLIKEADTFLKTNPHDDRWNKYLIKLKKYQLRNPGSKLDMNLFSRIT
jgi:hypothetical protein